MNTIDFVHKYRLRLNDCTVEKFHVPPNTDNSTTHMKIVCTELVHLDAPFDLSSECPVDKFLFRNLGHNPSSALSLNYMSFKFVVSVIYCIHGRQKTAHFGFRFEHEPYHTNNEFAKKVAEVWTKDSTSYKRA